MAARLKRNRRFDDRCVEAYRRLNSLEQVAEEMSCSEETVRRVLIDRGVDRRKPGSHGTSFRDNHGEVIRSLKGTPKCVRCGLRLDLHNWGTVWVPRGKNLCGFCVEELEDRSYG